MKPCDLLLSTDIIVTQNDSRDILKDAAVAVTGGSIAAIGSRQELEDTFQPTERLDLGRALIMPGLVNAHTHLPMTLLRGLADDLPLMEWLTGHIFPREARLTPRMLEVGTMLACAEMLRTGTTACADMYLNEPQVYRTVHKCGLRALVGEGIFAAQPENGEAGGSSGDSSEASSGGSSGGLADNSSGNPLSNASGNSSGHSPGDSSGDSLDGQSAAQDAKGRQPLSSKAAASDRASGVARSLSAAREQAAEVATMPRLRYAISPHSVYTTNFKLMRECAALADELDLPLHIHLAETPSEVAQAQDLYGCRPVEACRRAGLLGPRTLAAHAVELNKVEIELLAELGVSACHCPRSNMKLASGVSPVPALLKAGVNVALGTDGASSNNLLNMFAEMSAAALLHKVHSLDPTVLPAQSVLDMATRNGAKAIGWPEAGRLEPGAPADLIALDLTAPNLAPISGVASNLVYAATGHEVFLTMVEGQILYRDGEYSTIEYAEILAEAKDICDWLRDKN